jgi:RNA polymerase sigma-70 factor (sigma-E family)
MQQFGPRMRERDVSRIGAEQTPTEHLDAFVREEGQALLRVAFLLTGGRPAAAEDLVQAVLLRLVDRGIEDLNNPRTYVRRALVNEQRTQARRMHTHVRALTRLGARTDASNPAEHVADRIAVLSALAVLSRRERAAVVLRYYEDLADADIAEVLGCSRATVRSLVHRAMPKLKRALSQDGPPGATDRVEEDHHG